MNASAKDVQRWPFWLFGAWFVLSVVYLKVYWHARSEFQTAEGQARAGHLVVAIRHYGQTIRWYTPGNRYVGVAVDRLLRIGDLAFRRGDWEQAIIALQHLRNGLSSIRGVYQPHQKELVLCHQRLALVLSHLPGHTRAKTAQRRERQILIASLLSADVRPAVWLSLFVLLGYLFWLWLAARLCWSWSGMSWRSRGFHAVGALCSCLLWLVGLAWV